MKIDFSSIAEQEMLEAKAWYDEQSEGLGDSFLLEVEYAVDRINLNPAAWSKVSRRSRRCQLNRFPYGLIYQIRVRERRILILAVMHLHRHSREWKKRE